MLISKAKSNRAKKTAALTLILIGLFISTKAQSPHAVRLYGMTQYGGSSSKGTIFHYTPSTKVYTVDYEFQIKAKGKAPKCDIVSGNNGKYYGTTTAGGASGAGVIFSWDSITSQYDEPYEFNGAQGSDARGGMVLYNGKLYGMTNMGGSNGFGTIYEYDITTNTLTKKVDMDSINGKNPDGSLTFLNNKFYGLTNSGGLNNKGVIFEWDPSTNIYAKKFDFDSIKGSNPVGKLVHYNNKFYAMCNKGGALNLGTIFEWNYTTNIVTKKIDFNNTNGANPMGYLTLYNNKFYGVTYKGGSNLGGVGVIFEYNPASNAYSKKKDLGYIFASTNRRDYYPLSSLTLKGNVFYGTTSAGPGGSGGIFSWNPSTNVYTDNLWNAGNEVCEINRSFPGTKQYGALFLSGNNLLGTSAEGGGDLSGCIYMYNPDSNQIVKSVHMGASNGAYPKGSLSKLGNKLYGVTSYGGNNHAGNIFEWDINTQQYKVHLDFDGYTTGLSTMGSLTYFSGKFYGVHTKRKSTKLPGSGTSFPSTYATGRDGTNFFSWDPLTNTYSYLAGSGYLIGDPIVFNNKLYVTSRFSYLTSTTGGAVFQFNPITNSLNEVASNPNNSGSFNNYQDQLTFNGLIQHNGKFYGMTPTKGSTGGGNNAFRGTIYEWDTTTTAMINKIDFVDSIGRYPTGSLISFGNELYGLTSGIGNSLGGSFFKWNPATNTIQKKETISGGLACGTPIASGGKIFFMTDQKVSSIYEYDPLLDTTIIQAQYLIPLFLPGGTWNYASNCVIPNSFQKLLEVIPNKDPILQSAQSTQTVCSNLQHVSNFIITDADADTIHYSISSSNLTLLPLANINITNVDSLYSINYTETPGQIGNVILTINANDGYGGTLNFSVAISILPSPAASINPSGSTILCEGNSVILSANTSSSYLWSNGASTQTIVVDATSSYYVIEQSANGCSDTSDITNVIVNTLPNDSIAVNGSIVLCEGDSVMLSASPGNNYLWSNGATTQSVFIKTQGNYNVILQNSNNCIDTSNYVTITVNPKPIASITQNNTSLTANITAAKYQWINCTSNNILINDTNQIYSPIVNGNYAVIITDGNACIDTSNCVYYITTGLSLLSNTNFYKIVPNPAELKIQLITNLTIKQITIKNILGQELIVSKNKDIDISTLNTGTYMLIIETDKGSYFDRFEKISAP